jgi:type II secretory pathway component HofQ
MTVNELIEKLKEYGDEKARDLAQVRIVRTGGEVLDDHLDAFDVKFGIKSVDIPIDA